MSKTEKPTTWDEFVADFNESLDRVKEGATDTGPSTHNTVEFVRKALNHFGELLKGSGDPEQAVIVNEDTLKIVTEAVGSLFEVGGIVRFLLLHKDGAPTKVIIVGSPVRH